MDLDGVDRAYIDSLVKDEETVIGLISIVFLISPDGTQGFKKHIDVDAPISTTLGLLELVKEELLYEHRNDQ